MLLRIGAGLVCKSDYMQWKNEPTPEDELSGATGLSDLVLCTCPVIVDGSYYFLSSSQMLTY